MSKEDMILEILKSVQGQVGDMQIRMGDMQGQMGDVQGQIRGMQGQMEGMQDQMGDMQVKISDLDSKVDRLDTKVEILSARVTKVELHLENTTDRNIGLLMEQYKPNADKLDRVIEQAEVMQFDLEQLKKVVISHSNDLNILMQR